jgi:hypothetical protein
MAPRTSPAESLAAAAVVQWFAAIREDRLNGGQAALGTVAGADADVDVADFGAVACQHVGCCARQRRNGTGAAGHQEALGGGALVEGGDRADEVAAIGQIDVVGTRGDAGSRDVVALSLERPGRVHDGAWSQPLQIVGQRG